ncbi:MAG: chitobiase/beta-hexosaminidase C-terminal domain-containing protein [Ignavibacteriae bacterium]|nr:chitobiase/beta-hexosaminidase C-terminal domain-containing protein [Ignavibacteriota bacterium]
MRTYAAIGFAGAMALVLWSCTATSDREWVSTAPAGNEYTHIKRDGATVIPNGRFITPRGTQIGTAPHPYGLVLSPDGSIAVTANSGTGPFSVTIIRNVTGEEPQVQQVPEGHRTDAGILASVYMGLAIAPDNRTLYVAGGQEGKVYIIDCITGKRTGEILCDVPVHGIAYDDSYIGDMVMSADGTRLYAVDQMNFRMLVIDPAAHAVVANVPVGRYPFGITLSPGGTMAYVANVGVFVYERIKSFDPKDPHRTSLAKPPFAYGSREMREGIVNDSINVPGLGDPNVPESFSVWSVDIRDEHALKVMSKVKTGFLVGEVVEGIPALGGASPNSVVATDRYIFASNGNNDCISVIDVRSDSVVTNIRLVPEPKMAKYRGLIPFGLALAPDGKRLYVAEAGINAVGVIDVATLSVIGHLPAGWFPSKLKVSADGKKLIVANAKGYGSGPNGGGDADKDPRGTYIGSRMNGTVSVMDIPSDTELAAESRTVVENNFRFVSPDAPELRWRRANPIPMFPGAKESPIKHVVYVVKENRTYDEIFGQLQNGRGDSSLARYGNGRTLQLPNGPVLHDIAVMPNHHKLAAQFAVCDNFYCDSDVSADGHRWLSGTYPNEWVEVNVASAYGGGRNPKPVSTAPGVLAMTGSSGAVYPEDLNEAGTLWDHFERNKVDFFNFGFGLDQVNTIEDMAFKHTGERYTVNYPIPAPLHTRSSDLFPTWNMAIPDQFRMDMFIREFKDRWVGEGKTMPQVLTVYLPNDHGAGVRPGAGYPMVESYMMDNDLALGRLVDFLSHTPYWKNMAILVTEDDPQGGVDHVDAHRSIAMVISPYAKKGHVSHVHTSFGSLMKTMWNVLGVPYLNQYDASVADMADCFMDSPDPTPYVALPVDTDIFDPEKAMTPLDENFDWEALFASPELDDPETMKEWSEADREERGRMAAIVFPPVIEPAGGAFAGSQEVRIRRVGPSGTVHYTVDGSAPDASSPEYTTPFTITASTTVQAVTIGRDGKTSRMKSAVFTKGSRAK